MKPLFTAFLLVSGFSGWAQKPRIVKTDSSRIETTWYTAGKQVREIITAKDRVHYQFYRNHNRTATTRATYTKTWRPIGLTKEYDEQGHLLYTIDHDRGSWRAVQPKSYPFYDLQSAMKRKADTYIAALYGRSFLAKNAVWNVQESYLYNEGESGAWTEPMASKPVQFLFRYDVKLDGEHVYPQLIEFKLDAQGNFIPNESEEVYGFEQRRPVPANGFELVYSRAMETAKKKSGVRDQPLAGLMKWESWKKPSLYNGQFRFYVTVKTGSHQELHPKGRSRVTDYFDVYSFSPWNGAFLERKKMEASREWEKNSGSSYGLRPSK